MKEAANENKDDIKKVENVSLYEGVDRDIYLTDGSVALTDEAKRKKADALSANQDGKPFWDVFTIAAASSWAITGVTLAACIRTSLKLNYNETAERIVDFFDMRYCLFSEKASGLNSETLMKEYGSMEKAFTEQVKKLTIDVDRLKNDFHSNSVEECFADDFARAKWIDQKLRIKNILKYTTIALALISAGLTIAALLKNEEADLPPVPKYMVDSKEGKDGKRYTINYLAAAGNGLTAFKAEKKNKGPFADTKAYEGSQWLTVYQTKDEGAGKPIAPDFVVQEGKEVPSGYDAPLHIIGEKGASNLISAEYMNYSKYEKLKNKGNSVYVFYKSANDEGTASAFTGGRLAIFLIGGLAVIVLIAALVRRSKKNTEAA
jgi:hypothetical protein